MGFSLCHNPSPPPPPCCHFTAIFLHAKQHLLWGEFHSFISLSLFHGFFSRNAIFFFERFYENFDGRFFFAFFLVWRIGRPFNLHVRQRTKLILTLYNYCNLYVSHYQDSPKLLVVYDLPKTL